MSTHPTSSSGRAALPGIIFDYISAANDGRIDDATACFARDAVVHDENQGHQGGDAIRKWIAETTESSQPKQKILSATSDGEIHTVVSEISGDFPGSPVELEFQFVLTNGKISSLSIQ